MQSHHSELPHSNKGKLNGLLPYNYSKLTPKHSLELQRKISFGSRQLWYCIAGNFHLEKKFAFFAQAHRGRNFFGKLFYPVKFCHTEIFTCTGFYMCLPSSTSSASLSSISCFTRYSKPETSFSICSLAVRPSYRLLLSQRPTLLWMACSKLRPRRLRSERSIAEDRAHCTCVRIR